MCRCRGSISVFMAMIFMLVVSVLMMTLRSSIYHASGAVVAAGGTLSLDSVFASYDYELFKKYGILLFDGANDEDKIDEKRIAAMIDEYLECNTSKEYSKMAYFCKDIMKIKARTDVNKVYTPLYGGGLLWQDMAVDYEKYAKPIDLAAEYLNLKDDKSEADEVEKITNEINACTKLVANIEKNARELVEYVDGIKIDKDGVDFGKLKMEEYFVKAVSYDNPTMADLGISNQAVFDKVSARVASLKSIKAALENNRKELPELVKLFKSSFEGSMEKTQKALDLIDEIQQVMSMTDTKILSAESNLNSASTMDTEVKKSLTEDVNAIKEYREIMVRDICDLDELKRELKELQSKQNAISEKINNLSDKEEVLKDQLEAIESKIEEFVFSGMSFNYENMKKEESADDLLDKIKDFLDKGILSLVVPAKKGLSAVKIDEYTNMASTLCDINQANEYMKNRDNMVDVSKKIVYTEYLMDHFKCYTDYEKWSDESDAILMYDVEYALYGYKSDRKNLGAMAKELSLIRSGLNMLYIITDTEKKDKAYSIAFSLVGASGIEPLVKIVQYALLYLWSLGEGVADVRTLLSGGKIPIRKTADTWKTSLEALLSLSIDGDEDENDKGLDYKGYLRFLSYIKNDGKKAAYTMDLVEMYMMTRVNKEFRMCRNVYGIEAEIRYTVNGLSREQSYKIAQTY